MTGCILWDQVDTDDPTLAYVTMGAWHQPEDDPFAQVTTVLDSRQVALTGPLTARHLVEWACLGLAPSELQDSNALVSKGVALESPWELVQVYCAGEPHRFVRFEGSSQVVLASVDASLPVVISHRGALHMPLRLIDGRGVDRSRDRQDA